ncbi:hypothetical protein H0H93_003637 [Arthromyces matolae]|nr:hypothetical protein H0H93_013447 [Arthromyces matolae]KAG6846635.1 hypothetical protein H0H93_012714 [Arthromyces matolae]KAG6848073.1 hypothetical protein H0H93_003637 [Arthromyces matolae]
MSVPPRAYQASDLMSLTRYELIQLIRSQRPEIRLNSNLNKSNLQSFLLDPRFGFTTTNPPVEVFNTGKLAGSVNSFAVSIRFACCAVSLFTLPFTMPLQVRSTPGSPRLWCSSGSYPV